MRNYVKVQDVRAAVKQAFANPDNPATVRDCYGREVQVVCYSWDAETVSIEQPHGTRTHYRKGEPLARVANACITNDKCQLMNDDGRCMYWGWKTGFHYVNNDAHPAYGCLLDMNDGSVFVPYEEI